MFSPSSNVGLYFPVCRSYIAISPPAENPSFLMPCKVPKNSCAAFRCAKVGFSSGVGGVQGHFKRYLLLANHREMQREEIKLESENDLWLLESH